jgi:hypothetical protein
VHGGWIAMFTAPVATNMPVAATIERSTRLLIR